MVVLERLQVVDDEAVTYLCGVSIHSLIKSNICSLWASEQHLCVLGMCLRALDVHHMMYGQVHQGSCLNNIHVACMVTYIECTVMCLTIGGDLPLSYGYS